MKFKESPLVKNHKILTGTKRDMRKKVVKSTTPTSDLKKPTTLKRQLGGNIFTTYNSIAPYEGPVFEQPVATVEIEELPVNRLEANRRNVITKAEEKKEEPVVEEKVSTKPLPTSKEETPIVESKESTPINIKSKDEFIKTMTPAFENALKAKGLDTKYAKYLVAQSALESNWGKSQSGKFNFGGIKGKGTIRKTREVINGKSIHINDSFRDFKDINDYANYHVSLLNNKRYQAFSGGDFIDRVVKGGYATDPNYKKALSNVYNQIAKAQEGMKIPKLKGAGELKNRILRQFNREKAANRNEEQLIGFDWSRYKSNKPKPETTPTQSEQLENGGIIKYQNPSSGIQRRDAIKDYRPQIQEPIEQQYTPTQQPVLFSDNRTGWEKEVSRQIKADKAKNDKLYGNQHTWNWSAPFTNTRITKDNASAMFDFNKSAAMSTFATGIGVANPVATATSMVGSIAGAGIGNKIAGNKGALIGGFVGGMVNPNIRFGKSSSTRHQKYGSLNDINIHSKMNFDNYNQIMNKIKEEENLYRLYLQNKTVADRINKVAPSYRDAIDEFTKSGIKTKLGQPDKNFNAVNKVADDVEPSLGGVPFKHQENVYNLKPGETIIDLEPVAHENSHGIDRAMSSLMSTDYLKTLLNPNDKLPFHKWIQRVTDNKSIVDYVKQIRGLDMNNPADYPQIEKQIYNYFSKPTEIKAYFSRIPFEKYKKSVDRSFDGKIINNPVSEDIFQITDADILNDVRLQLIASIYGRNKAASYEALKSNLTNKIWGISALGIPTINTLINGYE